MGVFQNQQYLFDKLNIGENVEWINNSMSNAFYNCRQLKNIPHIHKNVTHMDNTFRDCIRLNGPAACGPNVINMSGTYSNC